MNNCTEHCAKSIEELVKDLEYTKQKLDARQCDEIDIHCYWCRKEELERSES